ncbi:MAG TPA: hypothetical protein DIU15_02580, partial [Deltaproteobacteria bacterium]|nr:hypothetical protein [Deltaproteobacteria bacterium]
HSLLVVSGLMLVGGLGCADDQEGVVVGSCSDGQDNDEDGSVDCDDPGCCGGIECGVCGGDDVASDDDDDDSGDGDPGKSSDDDSSAEDDESGS